MIEVVTQVQAFTFPSVSVVGKSDGAANLAKAFFRVANAEVLAKGLSTVDRGLVGARTFTHIIGSAIALVTAVACTTRTA